MVRRIIRGVTKLQFKQVEQDKRLRRLAVDITECNVIIDAYRIAVLEEQSQEPPPLEGQRKRAIMELAYEAIMDLFKLFYPTEYRLIRDDGVGMLSIIRTAFKYQCPVDWHNADVLSAFINHLEKLIKEGKHLGH